MYAHDEVIVMERQKQKISLSVKWAHADLKIHGTPRTESGQALFRSHLKRFVSKHTHTYSHTYTHTHTHTHTRTHEHEAVHNSTGSLTIYAFSLPSVVSNHSVVADLHSTLAWHIHNE